MVHVSTTFVNCNQKPNSVIPEEIIESKVDAENYIKLLMQKNPEALDNETPSILENFGFPNTYAFSKNLAE